MNVDEYIANKPFLKSLFFSFKKEDLGKIEVMHYASDMTMIKRNSLSDYVYLIVSGICGIFHELENGEFFCSYKISSYDVIGLSEVLVDNKVRNADIITLSNVVVFKIHKEILNQWMIKYPEFYRKIMYIIIDRLHYTLRKHIECKKYSAHINLVSYLIYSYKLYKKIYKEGYKGDVKINETRSMISDFIGISIRSTNNSIERLKNQNLLSIKLGKIYINYEQYKQLMAYKKKLLL